MPSMIFISYSQKDEAAFSSLCLALESAGLPYWPGRLKAGEPLKDQLRDAISKCEVCIFVATRTSVTSKWCLNEIGAFWGAGKRIILYAANHDIEGELPPLFRGDYWTSNAREVISQVREELAQVEKSQNQNHIATTESAVTKAGTNIVCLGGTTENLVMQGWTFYDLSDHEELKDHAYSTAIVEFENKPISGRRVEVLDAVEAQIFFYDSDGKEQQRVEGGAWIGEHGRLTTFQVGRRKRLVIAFRQGKDFRAVQNNRDTLDSNLKPTFFKLYAEWFRVYVRLIAHGEVVKEENFKLMFLTFFSSPGTPILSRLQS